MKLRHPTLIKAAGRAGAWILRAWIRTLRYRYWPLGPDLDPCAGHVRQPYLYAFWHEYLLLPAGRFSGPNMQALISQHADGQLIAEVIRRLGFGVVHGSTTRGGVQAVRNVLASKNPAHLGITPDGPRGPRRRVQMGLIYLASRLGRAIVPTGFAFDRPWRLKSWDRFALPRPLTRSRCITGAPIFVPPTAERDLLEEYRLYVEERMLDLTEQAERWAEFGIEPVARTCTPPGEPRRLAG